MMVWVGETNLIARIDNCAASLRDRARRLTEALDFAGRHRIPVFARDAAPEPDEPIASAFGSEGARSNCD